VAKCLPESSILYPILLRENLLAEIRLKMEIFWVMLSTCLSEHTIGEILLAALCVLGACTYLSKLVTFRHDGIQFVDAWFVRGFSVPYTAIQILKWKSNLKSSAGQFAKTSQKTSVRSLEILGWIIFLVSGGNCSKCRVIRTWFAEPNAHLIL
jgi:hypothetical protein